MNHVDLALAEQLERIEAEAWRSNQLAMPPMLAERLGISVTRIAGAVALQASRTDLLMLNRVIGLGFQPPLTEAILDDVIAVYRGAEITRFLISWSPVAASSAAADWMAARGFAAKGELAKLYLHARTPLAATAGPRVIQIDASRATEYGALLARAHGEPPELAEAHAATVGRDGWQHYLALDGERPIAGGCLYQRDEIAWCGFAATLPEHRRKGAQSALLQRRASDAILAGAGLITCEALPDTPTRPSPSFRNMRRAGFLHAYTRPHMLYDSAADQRWPGRTQ